MKKIFKGDLMKLNKSGFASIECIISLSIISLAMYMISTTLYDVYYKVNLNKEKLEMLRLAKEYIEEAKYKINNDMLYENCNTREINEYKVDILIEKDSYYDCNKINVEVKNDKKSINLYSYAVKR